MGPGDVCIHDKLYTMVILVIILILIITIILLVFFIYYTMDFCLRTIDRRQKRRKYPGAENCQSGPQHQLWLDTGERSWVTVMKLNCC